MPLQIQSVLIGGGLALAGVVIGAVLTHLFTVSRMREQRRFDDARKRRSLVVEDVLRGAEPSDDERQIVRDQLRRGGVIIRPSIEPDDPHRNWTSRGDTVVFGCIPADSYVLLADGSAGRIRDISVGDVVLGYDARTHTTTAVPVADLITGTTTEYVYVNEPIRVTPSQPVMCDGHYRNAGSLCLGHQLVSAGQRAFSISSISHRTDIEQEEVASIVLASSLGYFVGTTDVGPFVLIREGATGKTG